MRGFCGPLTPEEIDRLGTVNFALSARQLHIDKCHQKPLCLVGEMNLLALRASTGSPSRPGVLPVAIQPLERLLHNAQSEKTFVTKNKRQRRIAEVRQPPSAHFDHFATLGTQSGLVSINSRIRPLRCIWKQINEPENATLGTGCPKGIEPPDRDFCKASSMLRTR